MNIDPLTGCRSNAPLSRGSVAVPVLNSRQIKDRLTRMKLIAGNWKMNGLQASAAQVDALLAAPRVGVQLLICPPATLIARFAARLAASGIAVGGQDCHPQDAGAHTGDISATMLADAGASYVIVGHSERRADHGETDAMVRAKAEAAWRAGLTAILCVGESLAEREAGRAREIVSAQIAGSVPPGASAANLVIAYEPVWAVGSGLTPTPAELEDMHAAIAAQAAALAGEPLRLLYGGSVKPANAGELLNLPHVDGALVGGASLKAEDFLAIAEAATP